jgi:hypothetical protein
MTAEIIGGMAQRLSEGGYKVSREVALPDGPVATVAASKTYFSWKGLVILSQHIVVRQLDKARTQGFQELFEAGFRFGKQANGSVAQRYAVWVHDYPRDHRR